MRRFGVSERRARLGRRHHLAAAAKAGVVEVARDLVGLHGTDPATVYLAARARMADPDPAAVERALYDDRELVRILGMRRTMFVVPVELMPVVQAACTDAIAVQQRRLLHDMVGRAGMADDPAGWVEELGTVTVKALEASGGATATEVAGYDPRLGLQIVVAEGKPYEGRQSVVTRMLLLLAAEGRIVRGRPRGSWVSGQYRWSVVDDWLPDGVAGWSMQEAQTELVRRWLAGFGPATIADLKWWTGLPMGQVRRAVAATGAVEVDLDGTPGLVLADDLDPVPAPEPWAALLPSLDPTTMGWAGRDFYLGPHRPVLFDRNGNAGPAIWWDGRVVGGWAQRATGEVVLRLLEDVGADAATAIETEAARLSDWLGPTRVTPRFRTPLERELVA
ncbi:MAG TPA: winged helix DNA-binding domain-containing protein [Actinomycetota bacterium]|nr:winged helix DNA-binding domain-containing protein [Actinomycetota bacterium]